jgi:hypothetical protein
MFPIYGLSRPLFEPLHDRLRAGEVSPLRRALAYGAGFLAVEYSTGLALRRALGDAPWDYSDTRANVDGLIRLDYFPLWGMAGLALERLDDALRRASS